MNKIENLELGFDIRTESDKVQKAFDMAVKLHDGQFRHSGEPYISHCIGVLKIIAVEWGVKDDNMKIAALLHDTVEDTTLSVESIRTEFGESAAELVDGVTKLKDVTDTQEVKKIVKKSYLNPRIATLKLADRLHNMRTLEFMPIEKQISKSQETSDVYTKLAESMGMWDVKIELEDLCFKYLRPDEYTEAKKLMDNDERLGSMFTENLMSNLHCLLDEKEKGDVKIDCRKGGLWALSKKRNGEARKGKSEPNGFKYISDVVSVRVQIEDIEQIAQVVDLIYARFDTQVNYGNTATYIRSNKHVNGYEAVQISVNFLQGPVEIAVMTKKMEEFNRWGVLGLIRQNKEKELGQYSLKIIFTPTGSIRFLPPTATAIDYAYVVNPKLVTDGVEAKVDGEIRPLSTVPSNGSEVEIILGKETGSPVQGAEFYCMPSTRKYIMERRLKEKRNEQIEKGEYLVENVLKDRGVLVITDVGPIAREVFLRFGADTEDAFYFKMGTGEIKKDELIKELNKLGITKDKLKLSTIRMRGIDGPGVLKPLVDLIADMGKNITKIDHKSGEDFSLRVVVSGLTIQEQNRLKKRISRIPHLTESLVV